MTTILQERRKPSVSKVAQEGCIACYRPREEREGKSKKRGRTKESKSINAESTKRLNPGLQRSPADGGLTIGTGCLLQIA